VPFRSMPHIGELACFEIKMIGKPMRENCTYGLMRGTGLRSTDEPKRARSWKRPIQPRVDNQR
jgi:hypothetical protein